MRQQKNLDAEEPRGEKWDTGQDNAELKQWDSKKAGRLGVKTKAKKTKNKIKSLQCCRQKTRGEGETRLH